MYKLLSIPINHKKNHFEIINDCYNTKGKNLTKNQKQVLIKHYYDYFDNDLLTNKIIHCQIFNSKKYKKDFLIVGFSGEEYLFEVIEN